MDRKEQGKLLKIEDPVLRSQVLATLYTRISSGLELEESQPADLGMKSPSDAWNKANENLIDLARKDSQEGLNLAISLLGLPVSKDSHTERLNEWMRTSGLMLLGLDELKASFIDYLENSSDAEKLTSQLEGYIETDVSNLTSPHDFDGDPTGYSTVQSVFICLGLKEAENQLAKSLYNKATKRVAEPDFKTAFAIVSSFSDCAYLKERIS